MIVKKDGKMNKLYGKKLTAELAKRKLTRNIRLKHRISMREAAIAKGLTCSEYCQYERGEDICPHKKFEKVLVGVHPPFLVIEQCVKCHQSKIVGKLSEVSEDVLIEAFNNTIKNLKPNEKVEAT